MPVIERRYLTAVILRANFKVSEADKYDESADMKHRLNTRRTRKCIEMTLAYLALALTETGPAVFLNTLNS